MSKKRSMKKQEKSEVAEERKNGKGRYKIEEKEGKWSGR